MNLLTLVVNFIVAFYTMFVRYIYIVFFFFFFLFFYYIFLKIYVVVKPVELK